jgi:hypothetical protein
VMPWPADGTCPSQLQVDTIECAQTGESLSLMALSRRSPADAY